MPAKNKIKAYVENGYYHIYNRGVEKRIIYTDRQDSGVFLGYLKNYLLPKDIPALGRVIGDPLASAEEKDGAIRLLRMNNFAGEIDLLCYCLMPNHFHLVIKQKNARVIESFMSSLGTRYVQYFNKRHGDRVGSLFQDTYKAVLVETDEQLLWLTRYIHRNPLGNTYKGLTLKGRPEPSSYVNYLGQVRQAWVKPEEVLKFFSTSGLNSYENFVESDDLDERAETYLERVYLDKD